MMLLVYVGMTLLWLASSAPVVHIIPHSHCDTGYRKSFDDYYHSEVQYILNSMVVALQQRPDRRFVWEEVSYFSVWWGQASEAERQSVVTLVEKGQLEFIGGGWVMHDEADTSVYATLNQMTLGLKFLNETLNVRPRHEWHVDPFGHSIFMAELYSLLGYTSVIINRVPDPIKQQMKANRSLEFMWQSPFSGKEIFTHVLDSHYSTPNLPAFYNLDAKVAMFVQLCYERLGWYMTDNVLIPFGGDFAFQNATSDFEPMDEIVDFINNKSSVYGLTVRYSTLSEYMDTVLSAGVTFPSRGGDFLPYVACSPCGATQCGGIFSNSPCGATDSFWSGFYTSKPAQKLLSGVQDASLRALETIRALSLFQGDVHVEEALVLAKNTSAIMQHHDAITGTSFTESYDDYNVRLGEAVSAGDEATAFIKVRLLPFFIISLPLTSSPPPLPPLPLCRRPSCVRVVQSPTLSVPTVYQSSEV